MVSSVQVKFLNSWRNTKFKITEFGDAWYLWKGKKLFELFKEQRNLLLLSKVAINKTFFNIKRSILEE